MGESHEKQQGRPRQLRSMTDRKKGVGNFKRNTNLRLNLVGCSLNKLTIVCSVLGCTINNDFDLLAMNQYLTSPLFGRIALVPM